jgi:hypothetical protein
MRVDQKWGFGMAPPFRQTQSDRENAAEIVRQKLLDSPNMAAVAAIQESVSLFKGLITRSWKQDQWDWFTVWSQLGRPGRPRLKRCTDALYSWRRSAIEENEETFLLATQTLPAANLQKYISIFLKETPPPLIEGQVYILSTRENRDVLKIGYTTRSVEERVKEINSSTGVLIPYGVRSVWNVKQAAETEKRIHDLFNSYRVRADREFFQIDYFEAFDKINFLLREMRIETDD